MSEDKRVDLVGAAELLGVRPGRLRRLQRRGVFAPPCEPNETGEPRWEPAEVLRWAAGPGGLARRVRARYWPDPAGPADYLGAEAFEGVVVQTWQVQAGTVCVAWPLPDSMGPSIRTMRRVAPRADTLVKLCFDFGLDGPALDTATAEGPSAQQWSSGFETKWRDLSRVLGQPLPYWPHPLRLPELITGWQPGQPTVIYPARAVLDTTVLLRMVAAVPDDSPVHRVLLTLVREVQARETDSAVQDLEILAECERRFPAALPGGWPATVIAARPMPVVTADVDDLGEDLRRAAWLEILARDGNDALAVACVRELVAWDGGRDWPFSSTEHIDPSNQFGAEWAQRLTPISRTAAFENLDWHGEGGQTLTDPKTDAPAIRTDEGMIVAAVPQRVPALTPLAELILDDPIWIRTQDGTLYLAPEIPGEGVSWGYSGSGPLTLARLIERLLDDINAPTTHDRPDVPPGLRRLVTHEWPKGTVLTRAQLEAARADHTNPEEP